MHSGVLILLTYLWTLSIYKFYGFSREQSLDLDPVNIRPDPKPFQPLFSLPNIIHLHSGLCHTVTVTPAYASILLYMYTWMTVKDKSKIKEERRQIYENRWTWRLYVQPSYGHQESIERIYSPKNNILLKQHSLKCISSNSTLHHYNILWLNYGWNIFFDIQCL